MAVLSIFVPIIAIASFMGDNSEGRIMADGHPYRAASLTCASWDYPLGTYLEVSRQGKSVTCEVTDRGPARELYLRGRTLDLSEEAFRRLADPRLGLIGVTIRIREPQRNQPEFQVFRRSPDRGSYSQQ